MESIPISVILNNSIELLTVLAALATAVLPLFKKI